MRSGCLLVLLSCGEIAHVFVLTVRLPTCLFLHLRVAKAAGLVTPPPRFAACTSRAAARVSSSPSRHSLPQVMPPPAAPPQPPTARSLPDACIAEDELRAAVARAGREAAWLAAQRPISACLAAAVSARATCHDARAVRAVALCAYGPDASVLFPDQH